MKLVIAIVQPHRLDAVRQALTDIGINGMTVTEVRGYGRQKGHTEIYRGVEYTISFLPWLKIEAVLFDDRVEDAIATITRAARTGRIGDGKIFTLDLHAALRVRTWRRPANTRQKRAGGRDPAGSLALQWWPCCSTTCALLASAAWWWA